MTGISSARLLAGLGALMPFALAAGQPVWAYAEPGGKNGVALAPFALERVPVAPPQQAFAIPSAQQEEISRLVQQMQCNAKNTQLRVSISLIVENAFPTAGIPLSSTVAVFLHSLGLPYESIQEGQVIGPPEGWGKLAVTMSCAG